MLPWWNITFLGLDKYPQPFICCIYQTCLLLFILIKDSVYTWLPMSVQTSPQFSFRQTVNTLNKWSWSKQIPATEGDVLRPFLISGRAWEWKPLWDCLCNLSHQLKSVAFMGLKNGERFTPQRPINQALSSVAMLFLIVWWMRVTCISLVGADTKFRFVSFFSLIPKDVFFWYYLLCLSCIFIVGG